MSPPAVKTQQAYLHDHGAPNDMVDCSIIKIILGLKVKVFLVGTDGLQ